MNDVLNTLFPNLERLAPELWECLGQTFTMVAVSGTLAWIIGIAVGV